MEPGEHVGDYIIVRQIGEGGMSVVYLAEHKVHGTVAVVKRLRQQLALNEQLVKYFVQGARIMHELRHPHLAAVYDYIEQGDRYFMVEEYLSGGSLADLLDKGEAISQEEALRWCRDALRAVDYAHQSGIIHRDLKPGNLMLNQERQVKVTDFGIARVFGGPRLTKTGDEKGTPLYMSPEQIRTPDKVDHLTDVYSMGVVLYELLTRRLPFEGDSEFDIKQAVVREPPAPPRQLNRTISREAERIVLKALQKRPENRFSGCGEFALDIDRCLSRTKVPTPTTGATRDRPISQPRPHQEESTRSWNPWGWIQAHPGIAVGLSILLLALILAPFIKQFLSQRPRDNVIPAPTIEFGANPLKIAPGQEATLEWKVDHARTVRIEPGIGEVPPTGSRTVSPTASVSYLLTATGPGGTTSKGIDLAVGSVSGPIPAIEFTATPSKIKAGEAVKLVWKVQDAATVRIDPEIGDVAADDSREVFPSAPVTYSLSATGPGGIAKQSVAIIVLASPTAGPPLIDFAATPARIKPGESTLLEWNVQNAYRIRIDPDIGEVQTPGSRTQTPHKSVSYVLTATGKGGIETKKVDIAVEAPTPTVELTVNPTMITPGQTATLSWKAHNAQTVHIEPGIGDVGTSGSHPVTPARSTTFVATAAGPGGTGTAKAEVRVGPPLPRPTITSLVAKPPMIRLGETLRLEWATQNAQTVHIEGLGSVDVSGFRDVKPSRSGSVTMTATGPGGTDSQKITLVVADGNAIKIKTMECRSRDSRLTTCDFTKTVSQNDRILGVVFWRQNGRSAPCIEGGTYRIDLQRGIIGVTQGCDADFRVFYRAQ
jgi:serine/threonine protein kinase